MSPRPSVPLAAIAAESRTPERGRVRRAIGPTAAALWLVGGFLWFDTELTLRPAAFRRLPAGLCLIAAAALAFIWLLRHRKALLGELPASARNDLLLVVTLALLFRFPMAFWGAAGYTTADGALSGIVALHVREGTEHHVFVPEVPYSGSLKSHLTAALGVLVELPRAFTFVSMIFYAVFVAGLFFLAWWVDRSPPLALAAGLLVAFSPPFVTHYSLSNDGNYVEVLALGTWALALSARWATERAQRATLEIALGLVFGLAFWCHILVVLHIAAIGVFLVLVDHRAAGRALPRLLGGFVLGDWPGLLWNASHAWDSFRSLVPAWQPAAAAPGGPDLVHRARALVTDHLPVLLGYDPGNDPGLDVLLRGVGVLGMLLAFWAFLAAVRDARRRPVDALWLLLLFTLVNVGIVLIALRYVPENPRYLLFLMAPLPILLARRFAVGRFRALHALLLISWAVASMGQAIGEAGADARWRGFVADLEHARVRFCSTDFYIATPINFLSEERIVCSSKLGPTRTEYFIGYRERVDRASEVALIATNKANAEKLERRLAQLRVTFERRDLMKPVLLRLSRKVDPAELFPGQSFGWR